MSLTVSNDLLDQARAGEVDDAAFVACVRDSLPYAWSVISGLVDERARTGAEFADNTVPRRTRPPAASSCAAWPATPCAAPWSVTSA
nr:hypothetical protein GCM10020093_074670 [Planobispora longispora]